MLEVTHLEAFNFEGAIRGMRQPFKSIDKSDSGVGCYSLLEAEEDSSYNEWRLCKADTEDQCSKFSFCDNGYWNIGLDDLRIAQNLISAGPPHDKFMRQIFVSMDIRAPLYW